MTDGNNKTIKNPKEGTMSFKSTCDMTFKVNDPKRLTLSKQQRLANQMKPIKHSITTTPIQIKSNDDDYNASIKNQLKSKTTIEPPMRQKLLDYYNNPFAYIDHLLESYFKKKLSFHSDDEVKAKIKEDFETFFKSINFKLNQFKLTQKAKLKQLDDQIELRLKRKRNKVILKETDELSTEPIYANENIEDIFLDDTRSKYTTIVSSIPSSKESILNDLQSQYYVPNISKTVLSCLDENTSAQSKLKPPNRAFIESNDIRVNSDNRDALLQLKHLLEMDRANEHGEEKYNDNIANEVGKTIEVQRKMYNDIVDKSKADLAQYDEAKLQLEYDELLKYMKKNLESNRMFDKLTMSRLALFKEDIETIKRRLLGGNDGNDNKDVKELDSVGRKMAMIRIEENDRNEEIEDCLRRHGKAIHDNGNGKGSEVIDDNIAMMYAKLNNDAIKNDIGNRIYYNDNPYHYHYNYIGTSIPIVKNLKKTYNGEGIISNR